MVYLSQCSLVDVDRHIRLYEYVAFELATVTPAHTDVECHILETVSRSKNLGRPIDLRKLGIGEGEREIAITSQLKVGLEAVFEVHVNLE